MTVILMSLLPACATQLNHTFYDSVLVIRETHIAHPTEVFYFSFLSMSIFLGVLKGGQAAMTLNLFYSFL